MTLDRRRLLLAAGAAAALPPAIARAKAIDARVGAGTIADVAHVVIFMQENRGFDHYFGAMAGVRGFADRFPIPLEGGRTVWLQGGAGGPGRAPYIAPFPLETAKTFAHMRVEGTPHNWTDAQAAWDQGRMDRWPAAKGEHAMAYYRAGDIPFQYALAEAFTVCDAYHCSMQVGTNTNRLFLFTGTHDPMGLGGGPSLDNSHDSLPSKGGPKDAYAWTTYPERLTAAGVSWRVYQDMADNFGDNPLEGFQAYRDSLAGAPGSDPRLARDGLTTYGLDRLKADVMAGDLPQVVHIIAPAKASEHPGPSSPAQGADYTARVLDALTANPEIWGRTVLFLMFDENDGYFDHAPPPAPPSRDATGALLGASTIDLAGEHHLKAGRTRPAIDRPEFMGRPYGLGPRTPMYVISPWSRGGFVSSEVFDHTSVIRFLERRFGVMEPNISPWRRAVCGDLTSCFDFKTPNRPAPLPALPATAETAARAAALTRTTRPPTPAAPAAPEQAAGVRPSRALPYQLEATASLDNFAARLAFSNVGSAGAVFHVYDLQDLTPPPRRYTVGPGERLLDSVALIGGACDLWILGPNGFHRRIRGTAEPRLTATPTLARSLRAFTLTLKNGGATALEARVAGDYGVAPWTVRLAPGASAMQTWPVDKSAGWYDLTLTAAGHDTWLRRFAGRLENGRDLTSDPAMGGPAILRWDS